MRAAATAAVGLIVRTLALQVVLVVTTAVAARQGDAAIAAHQVAFRICLVLLLARPLLPGGTRRRLDE